MNTIAEYEQKVLSTLKREIAGPTILRKSGAVVPGKRVIQFEAGRRLKTPNPSNVPFEMPNDGREEEEPMR
jgi:hypothetical protein